MSNIYSQTKAMWHPDQIKALREGRRPIPVHVQLILSDLCNQDCHFCAYRMSAGLSNELFVGDSELAKVGTNNPKRQIPTDKAFEIVKDCAKLGVKAMQFTGGGEPTVHPNYLQIIQLAQDLGMETSLVTNGLRLKPLSPTIQALKWIRISIDAGTAQTYAAVRRVDPRHWYKVWDNIQELAPLYSGVLGVGYVVTLDNYTEVASAADLAKQSGVHNMRVGAVFSRDGDRFYEDKIPEICEYIQDAKSRYDGNGFEVLDLFGRRLNDLTMGSPTDPWCSYQYFTVYIGGDLGVYRCCNTAYTLAGRVGSLKDQSFLDVFPKLGYEPFDATKCRFCQFIGQNKAINSLLKEPTHVNFV